MWHRLALHRNKLILIAVLWLSSLVATLWLGELKAIAMVDWLDVVGEGGSALALALWLVLILASRPAGRVTDWLTLGLGFMFLAMWQDALDEFVQLVIVQWWDQWLENFSMPLGIGLLTYGLFHWHSEQLAINEQLKKRERLFREHRMLDRLTQIGKIDYLKKQLESLVNQSRELPLALLMIDVDDFALINRHFGHRQGDRLLHQLSELLLLNLRDGDLICRYGGDRFAVLLPHTEESRAQEIAAELQQAVQYFAFKIQPTGESRYQRISVGLAWTRSADELQPAEFIHRANQQLARSRQWQEPD
ncbi:GGDEF domain-containing protein [Bacterioplanoides pacificum]|uniref:diguanylate cyclase n=1 Tax=Bacterioplanoides pacificum TaxID=1171596 RepID=A0ABV7VT36_9GAMM